MFVRVFTLFDLTILQNYWTDYCVRGILQNDLDSVKWVPKSGVLTNPQPEITQYTQIWILFSFNFCLQYLILFTIQIANKFAMKVLRNI